MTKFAEPAHASCTCGAVQVDVHGTLTRFYCHCNICQRVGKAPFGDPVFLWRHHLKVHDPSQLHFKRHRWTPNNVNRGTCRKCEALVIEHLAATPFSIVIGRRFDDQTLLPPAVGHAFYESRVEDADDALPKHQGFFRSEMAITGWLLAGLFRRG